MPTHLYCLLPTGNDATPSGVRALAAGPFIAWVGDTETEAMPRDTRRAAQAAIEHDLVIGVAVSRGISPVPATLTDPYASDADALSDIASRTDEIRQAFARTEGAVEMTTIVAPRNGSPGAASAQSGTGRAYLEGLRDAPALAEAVANGIDGRLRSMSSATARRAEGGRISLSHLIDRSQIEVYRATALEEPREGYRIVVDGPRAPYSFAAFAPRRPAPSVLAAPATPPSGP